MDRLAYLHSTNEHLKELIAPVTTYAYNRAMLNTLSPFFLVTMNIINDNLLIEQAELAVLFDLIMERWVEYIQTLDIEHRMQIVREQIKEAMRAEKTVEEERMAKLAKAAAAVPPLSDLKALQAYTNNLSRELDQLKIEQVETQKEIKQAHLKIDETDKSLETLEKEESKHLINKIQDHQVALQFADGTTISTETLAQRLENIPKPPPISEFQKHFPVPEEKSKAVAIHRTIVTQLKQNAAMYKKDEEDEFDPILYLQTRKLNQNKALQNITQSIDNILNLNKKIALISTQYDQINELTSKDQKLSSIAKNIALKQELLEKSEEIIKQQQSGEMLQQEKTTKPSQHPSPPTKPSQK